MENLRLKEEIRRLKLSREEGEWERMNEQIMILQKKLLEALDWKLMHESDPSTMQRGVSELAMDVQSDSNLLGSSKEPTSPWVIAVNEENEFLRMQAIQNQSEMDTLRKKLDSCIEERDKLERHMNDLVAELEAERSLKVAMKEEMQKLELELPPLTSDLTSIALNDQIELKTMVDAIAAASQREAKAHEIAVVLSRENDELRMKLKILIEDNNKLIEIYERTVSENLNKASGGAQNSLEENTEDQNSHCTGFAEEKELQRKKEVDLEHQLAEMHEENEKLLGLYEAAMQERDEFKRMHSSGRQTHVEEEPDFNGLEKLLDEGEPMHFNESSISGKENGEEDIHVENSTASAEAKILLEESLFEVTVHDDYSQCSSPRTNDYVDIDELPSFVDAGSVIECDFLDSDVQDKANTAGLDVDEGKMFTEEAGFCRLNAECLKIIQVGGINENGGNDMDMSEMKVPNDSYSVRLKLDKVQEMLLHSTQTMTVFGSLERAIIEIEELSREIEGVDDSIRVKQEEYTSSKVISSEMLEKRVVIEKKLNALKYSASSFSSSVGYFEQREMQARSRLNVLLSKLNQKKEELARLEVHKDESEEAQKEIQLSEVELKNFITELKRRIEEENRRQENEKVLIAIDDNVDKTEVHPLQRTWCLGGKATELLKSEEEKTKLQHKMKQARHKFGIMRREAEDLNSKFKQLDSEMEVVQMEIQKGTKMVEEMNHKLQNVIEEKQQVLEMKDNGVTEFENLIFEYQQCFFESQLKEEEMKILEEELQVELRRTEELQTKRSAATERKAQLLVEKMGHSCLLSDKIEEELQNIRQSFMELKAMLGDDCSSEAF